MRYEQVANYSLSSPLTKFNVKEYWLRAGLCALALGVSILRLKSITLLKLSFPDTRILSRRNGT